MNHRNTKSLLNHQDSEPLYLQVAKLLKERIADGTYAPESKLPTELEFTAQLEVSRPTVRHALKILLEEGLIERVPGRGTFVTSPQRRLPHQGTGNLAIIGPETRDFFFSPMVLGAEHVTSQNGYLLTLRNAGNQLTIEQRYLRDLWEEERVDGFLLMVADAPEPHQVLLDFLQMGVPIVFIDRYFEGLDAPFVVSDNLQGGYLATKHLIDLGHRQIGFISAPNTYVSSVGHRFQGYQRALAEASVEYNPGLVFQGLLPLMSEMRVLGRLSSNQAKYDRSAIRKFLDNKYRPTAIVTCDDVIAIRTLEACRELGIRVPEDMAIVGFDDDSIAALVSPPLTTIRQHKHKMGAHAAETLLNVLNNKPVEQKVFLPTELVVRQSCGAQLIQGTSEHP